MLDVQEEKTVGQEREQSKAKAKRREHPEPVMW